MIAISQSTLNIVMPIVIILGVILFFWWFVKEEF